MDEVPGYGYDEIFYWSGDERWELGQTILGDDNGDDFGRSVSLSADGITLVIGADNSNDGTGLVIKIYRS